MIEWSYNRFYIIIDIFTLIVSYLISYFIRFKSNIFFYNKSLSFKQYLILIILLVPLYITINYICDLYTINRLYKNKKIYIKNIIKSNLLICLIFIVCLYILNMSNFSRLMLIIFFICNSIFFIINRIIMNIFIKNMFRYGYSTKNILLIGYSKVAKKYIDKVQSNLYLEYVIKGILDDYEKIGTSYKGIKVLDRIDNIKNVISDNDINEVIISINVREYYKLNHIKQLCDNNGIYVKFIPDYYELFNSYTYTENFEGLPIINVRYTPLNILFNKFIKRFLDIIFSILFIIIFSPICIIIAVIIKFTTNSSVIFKQERVGLYNKIFVMYKFRTMNMQPKNIEKEKWTVKNDSRTTKIGSILRKLSLDELPQFINVLKGDMSIVGPRPERPQFVNKFKNEIDGYMTKHQVRPGITGFAQINGFRGNTSIKKRLEYDIFYILNWSLFFDFKIMFLTLFKGFINKNAY